MDVHFNYTSLSINIIMTSFEPPVVVDDTSVPEELSVVESEYEMTDSDTDDDSYDDDTEDYNSNSEEDEEEEEEEETLVYR